MKLCSSKGIAGFVSQINNSAIPIRLKASAQFELSLYLLMHGFTKLGLTTLGVAEKMRWASEQKLLGVE